MLNNSSYLRVMLPLSTALHYLVCITLDPFISRLLPSSNAFSLLCMGSRQRRTAFHNSTWSSTKAAMIPASYQLKESSNETTIHSYMPLWKRHISYFRLSIHPPSCRTVTPDTVKSCSVWLSIQDSNTAKDLHNQPPIHVWTAT